MPCQERRRLPAGAARIGGFDATWEKAPGKARPVAMAVDLPGRRLRLALTGPGFDRQRWLRELADRLGMAVVATDDSSDCAGPVAAAGLRRPRCMAPRKRALGRWENAGPPIAGSGIRGC